MHCSVTCHSTCVESNALFHESRFDLWVCDSFSYTYTRVSESNTVNCTIVRGRRFLPRLRTFQGFGGQQIDLTFAFF